MRIALIRPKCGNKTEEEGEPLGILILGAEMLKRGHNARVFDQRLIPSRQEFMEELKCFSPDIVGFSLVTGDDVRESLRTLLELKEFNNNIIFVAGGLYITFDKTAAAIFPKDTVLLPFDGELSLGCLAELAEKGERNFSGILPTRPPLDSLAFALRTEAQAYSQRGLPVNISGSRGCVGRCAFCCGAALPAPFKEWQGRSVGNIADEIESVVTRHGLRIFQFVDDDAFGTRPVQRASELCHELEKRNLKIVFSMQVKAQDLLMEGMDKQLKRLSRWGLVRLFVGVESLDEEVLKSWSKPVNPVATLEMLSKIREYQIEIALGYIAWHRKTTRESFAAEMKTLYEFGFFNLKAALSKLAILPGSPLSKTMESWEFEDPNASSAYGELLILLEGISHKWYGNAVKLPYALAKSRLGDGTFELKRIREELKKLDKIAYDAVKSL